MQWRARRLALVPSTERRRTGQAPAPGRQPPRAAFLVWMPVGITLVVTAPAGAARFGASSTSWVSARCSASRPPTTASAGRRRTKAMLGRLDHSTIFLAIAGTYTPVALVGPHGWARVVDPGRGLDGRRRRHRLAVAAGRPTAVGLHAGVRGGRVVRLLVLPQLWEGLGPAGFVLLLAGGAFYTIGAVVYALKKPDPWPATFGYHEVFHACTIVALVAAPRGDRVLRAPGRLTAPGRAALPLPVPVAYRAGWRAGLPDLPVRCEVP